MKTLKSKLWSPLLFALAFLALTSCSKENLAIEEATESPVAQLSGPCNISGPTQTISMWYPSVKQVAHGCIPAEDPNHIPLLTISNTSKSFTYSFFNAPIGNAYISSTLAAMKSDANHYIPGPSHHDPPGSYWIIGSLDFSALNYGSNTTSFTMVVNYSQIQGEPDSQLMPF